MSASRVIPLTSECDGRGVTRPHGGRPRWIEGLVAGFLAFWCAGCAAPLQRIAKPVTSAPGGGRSPRVVLKEGRPTVGVAFGGGSARGIAHVGVIRWLEEHRIPIDVAAGTSMGGLVGGAFASGMDSAELQTFITTLNWDQLFGSSTFPYKNIRRKADARAYPSRLEFGLKGGVVPPTALNSGQDVELLLGRIAAPYFDTPDFDDLPTPFRTVAVDLLSAQPVVMRSGSLSDAMRDDVSAAHLPAHRTERTGAHRWRHHGQRASGHRERDGGGPRDRRERRRSPPTPRA